MFNWSRIYTSITWFICRISLLKVSSCCRYWEVIPHYTPLRQTIIFLYLLPKLPWGIFLHFPGPWFSHLKYEDNYIIYLLNLGLIEFCPEFNKYSTNVSYYFITDNVYPSNIWLSLLHEENVENSALKKCGRKFKGTKNSQQNIKGEE